TRARARASRERPGVLGAGRVAAHPRLDDRVRPPRLPTPLPCRNDRPLRALSTTTHSASPRAAKPRQPPRPLALGTLSPPLLLVHRNLPERRVAADRTELGGGDRLACHRHRRLRRADRARLARDEAAAGAPRGGVAGRLGPV